jgi:hypothetical protein
LPLLALRKAKSHTSDLAKRCAAQDAIGETTDLIEAAVVRREISSTDRDITSATV